jgi:hypothetical protein
VVDLNCMGWCFGILESGLLCLVGREDG